MTPGLRNTLLALVFALGALVLALEIAARAEARRLVTALSPVASLDYRSAGIDWSGRLRLVAPRVTFHQGPWRGTASARSAYLRAGSVFWTLAQSLRGGDKLPAQGIVEMHGLVVSPVADYVVIGEWLQPPGMVLFELDGCEGGALSPADRQRMPAALTERVDRIDYRIDETAQRLELAFAFEQPAIATLRGSAAFSGFNPARWSDARARAGLRLRHAELAYEDPGYLGLRNAFCARRNGVSTAQFIERHVMSVDNRLADLGITPSESLRRMYRDFVGKGGTLTLTMLPDADWEPAAFAGYSRADLLRLLNITARHNDTPPVMLQLAFAEPVPAMDGPASEAPDAPVQEATARSATATGDGMTTRPEVATVEPVPAPITPAAAAVGRVNTSVPSTPTQASTHVPAEVVDESDAVAPVASAAPPPKDSTLALVWKPGVVERLAPREAPARDYDVVAVTALAAHAGRRVRLLTQGGKRVDGELRRVEDAHAIVQVRLASGSAEIRVALANVLEARLVHAGAR